jgi:1-acyl-sn-glycerol-3-phosphate acyltransferase
MIAIRASFPGGATLEESIPGRALGQFFGNMMILTARALTGAEARWVGCAPVKTQRIYVANHTSHADFVLLWAALPSHLRSQTCPVAAADYWKKGFIRRYFAERVFHGVLVERERVNRSHNPLTPMLEVLHRGKSLIMFPEGTRGDGVGLQPFKCGVYHLASSRPDVEVVPVWIDNLHRVLPKGSALPAPLLSSVTFGTPTHLARGEGKHEFLDRIRQSVLDLRKPCA